MVKKENLVLVNLNNMSRALLRVHRSLLMFQKNIFEELEGRPLTPHELLNLSLTHVDFEWLRKLSTLIVEIDEGADDESADHGSIQKEAVVKLSDLFINGKDVSFMKRIESASNIDAQFCIELSELKKYL